MIQKNKHSKSKTPAQDLGAVARRVGFTLMTAVAVAGMVELPHHKEKQAVVPAQPTFSVEADAGHGQNSKPERREREETGPHYLSYGAVQRTAARAGRA